MEKNVKVSMLLNIYGKLLTEKQYETLDNYYNSDLSLSEIAENMSITRQAVRDNIKKGENKLFEFEEKLEVMKRAFERDKKITNVLSELTKLETNSSDKQVQKVINHIMQELSCLV